MLKYDKPLLTNWRLFLKVTHSSGNHGQAVAWAAGIAGVKSCVVIPRTAPKVKAAAIEGYGAELVFCEPNPQSRYCYGNMTCFSSGTAAVYLFWVHDFTTCRRKGSRYSNLIFRCSVLSTTICRFASVLFFLSFYCLPFFAYVFWLPITYSVPSKRFRIRRTKCGKVCLNSNNLLIHPAAPVL